MKDEALRFCQQLRNELLQKEHICCIWRDSEILIKLFVVVVMKKKITSFFFLGFTSFFLPAHSIILFILCINFYFSNCKYNKIIFFKNRNSASKKSICLGWDYLKCEKWLQVNLLALRQYALASYLLLGNMNQLGYSPRYLCKTERVSCNHVHVLAIWIPIVQISKSKVNIGVNMYLTLNSLSFC